MGIRLNDAMNIDNCEKAVLQVVCPSVRSALSDHLSAVSEKMAIDQAGQTDEVVANVGPYRVDGEAGRFTIKTHSVIADGQVAYNTAKDVFKSLNSMEYHKTAGFKELAFIYGDTEESFRKTGKSINRIRYRKEGGRLFERYATIRKKRGRKLMILQREKRI